MLKTNKDIVLRIFESAWNRGDLSILDDVIADGYVDNDSANGQVNGLQGVKRQIASYRAALSGYQIFIEDQIAERDMVVTRWTATGTHTGELFGMKATQRRVAFRGISIDQLVDGKLVRSWSSWDRLELFQQLSGKMN